MEAVPSMDDLLDEVEDLVRAAPQPLLSADRTSGPLIDRGNSVTLCNISRGKTLDVLPSIGGNFFGESSCKEPRYVVRNEISHSPTPSEQDEDSSCGGIEQSELRERRDQDEADHHHLQAEIEGAGLYPGKVGPLRQNVVKLFAKRQDPDVEPASELRTEDPEYQDVLAYLGMDKQPENDVEGKQDTSNVEELDSPPAPDHFNVYEGLSSLDVSTASPIPSSEVPVDMQQEGSAEGTHLASQTVAEIVVPDIQLDCCSTDSLPEDERALLFTVSTSGDVPPGSLADTPSSSEDNTSPSPSMSRCTDEPSLVPFNAPSRLSTSSEKSTSEVPIANAASTRTEIKPVDRVIPETAPILPAINLLAYQIASEVVRDGVNEAKFVEEEPRGEAETTDDEASSAVADDSQTANEGGKCEENVVSMNFSARSSESFDLSTATVVAITKSSEASDLRCGTPTRQGLVKTKDLGDPFYAKNGTGEDEVPSFIGTTATVSSEATEEFPDSTPEIEAEETGSSVELVNEEEQDAKRLRCEGGVSGLTGTVDVDIRLRLEGEEDVAGDEDREEAHAETAIEIASGIDVVESNDGCDEAPERQRFNQEVIAVVHDMAEASDPNRLTESELQLGKTKPYWIPDEDCAACMLCSARFSLLNRRHHCRACGRVLCASCCKEKTTLAYLGDDEKKNKARVCLPCLNMLERIREYENAHTDLELTDGAGPSRASARGVLKSRVIADATASVAEGAEPPGAGPSQGIPPEGVERKRSVVFRDGLRPGEASTVPEDRSSTRPTGKKKTRKRVHVARKLASLKLEEELADHLPADKEGNKDTRVYLVRKSDGVVERTGVTDVDSRLADRLPVEIILKRNLTCVIQYCTHPIRKGESMCCVASRGFFAIGVDEVVFLWEDGRSRDEQKLSLPHGVLERVSEMFESCLEGDSLGIRPCVSRLPSLHSSPLPPLAPCTRHVLTYRPNMQEVCSPSVPWPRHPFVLCMFVLDQEMVWALSAPNRLLLRLGLLASWYPTPLVNTVGRSPVFCGETSNSVLKVFTDFRNWNYRMQHVPGSTVALSTKETLVLIPKSAGTEMKAIVEWNKRMLAWSCDLNSEADSHLVCVEHDGSLGTQVLARGATRNVTGTSFIIIDAGLKSAGESVQISVVEDGIAVRMSSESLEQLVEALLAGKDWTLCSASSTLRVQWTDGSSSLHSQLISPIDGLFLGHYYQYGLSLARAVTTALQVPSCPDHAVRLSHVFHLENGRMAAENEAKIFSVAEMLAREATSALDTFLPALIGLDVDLVAVRFRVSVSDVAFEVSPWCGLEEERQAYKSQLDQLLPVLVNLMEYLPGGFHLEIHLTVVSTKDPLPLQ